MVKADNRLNGATNLGLLGATPLEQGDKFKLKDIGTSGNSLIEIPSSSGLIKSTSTVSP
jgi:hypothetical protein